MSDSLDILRSLGEKFLNPNCHKDKEKLPLSRRLKNKIKYGFKPRRWIGRKILGNPRYGQGILMQVDLARKTKEEVDAFWKALEYFRKAGIRFDTGMGCQFDMELDWSLTGAVTKCKKCGYNSETNRMWLDIWKEKEHFTTSCEKCYGMIDSSNGYWKVKKHFWTRTKYFHPKCHDSGCNCRESGGCNRCQSLG